MGLFDYFKKKQSNSNDRNLQTIYFVDGQLHKIVGKDENNWYDADILVSDGTTYDLRNIESIQKIPVPHFKYSNPFDGYGVTGSLDYVLRMKAGNCFNREEKQLCSALLWKSTELMIANKFCAWRQKDFERLVKWHYQMGMDDEAEKGVKFLADHGMVMINPKPTNPASPKHDSPSPQKSGSPKKKKEPTESKLSYVEKERIMVQRVTLKDMQELTNMPFVWNTEIKKQFGNQSHPFAYMEIVGENVDIVKNELKKINKQIAKDKKSYPHIPAHVKIPVDKIVFHSDIYGYTRIMCSPKTFTEKKAKYPLTLHFTTDFSKSNTTHGELVYNQEGQIASANVYRWDGHHGFFLKYKTIDGQLVLNDTESARATITETCQ